MADAHAGDVGDRVQRAWLEVAEPEAEVAEPIASGRHSPAASLTL